MALPFANASFNVVLCQQGLQFFPDRLAALREMHRVLVPNGRRGLSVWRPIQQNPYMAAVANAVERRVSVDVAAGMRTVCALGDAEVLRSLLLDAGFREVRICIAIQVMRFSSVETFLPGQVAATLLLRPLLHSTPAHAPLCLRTCAALYGRIPTIRG